MIDKNRVKFESKDKIQSIAKQIEEDHKDQILEMLRTNDHDSETLAEVMDMDPRSLEALYTIGYQYYNSGDFKQAIQIFNCLAVADHTNFKYRFALGGVFFEIGNYPGALIAYGYILMHDHKNLDAMYWIFRTMKEQGAEADRLIKLARGFMETAKLLEAEDSRKYNKMYNEMKIYIKKMSNDE